MQIYAMLCYAMLFSSRSVVYMDIESFKKYSLCSFVTENFDGTLNRLIVMLYWVRVRYCESVRVRVRVRFLELRSVNSILSSPLISSHLVNHCVCATLEFISYCVSSDNSPPYLFYYMAHTCDIL